MIGVADGGVDLLISISNDETEKAAAKQENQDSSQTEESPTEDTFLNSHEIESFNKNYPGNKSASSIRTNPQTPQMCSPGRAEDDDVEEIIKRMKLKRRQWNIRRKDMLQWALNFCILGCLVAFKIVEKLQSKMVWSMQVWKWCVFGMAICWGKLLVNWIIQFTVFLIEMNFMLRKKALYFVIGLKNSIQVFSWMLLVLVVWKYLLDHTSKQSKTATKMFKYVTRTIVSTLIGSFLFLLKRLWLLVLAYDFHINAFFDKIQETMFHQYILRSLSGPPLLEATENIGKSTGLGQSIFQRSKGIQKMAIDYSGLWRRENVSSWNMKVLADEIRNSPLLVSSTLNESFNDEDTEICSEMEATAAAYRIFKNVAKPGSKYMYEEDLLRFMLKEELCVVFPMIEGHEAGRIGRKSFTDWVIRAYNSRKVLSHSIADIENIIEQVNRIVTWILVVVVIIVWIILMEFIKLDVIVLLLSAAAFMLGNPFKSLFDAIIFVFVVHPFDVGDRCVVDGIELLVEEISILTTVFLKPNNEKVLYPNSVLASKPISNYYRSPDMGDAVEFSIDYSTPKQDIELLKEKLKRYLEMSPHHWHPQHSIVVKDVENLGKINMILYCHHCINFQEFGEKNKRRAELLDEIMKLFEELNIKFYNIRCSDNFAGGLPSQQ